MTDGGGRVGEPPLIATTWRSYVAEAPAWGIVFGALAVSFWTQVGEVSSHGFAMWEALVWGTSTDAGTIACLFLAREGAHRGTPTWGAWVLSIACAFLSVQFNVVAGVRRGDWLAVEAHVWMPALALGVWYWLLHGRHRRWILPQTWSIASADGEGRPRKEPGADADLEDQSARPRSATHGPLTIPVRKSFRRRPAGEVLALVRAARARLVAETGRDPRDEEVAARVSADGHPITASRVRTYLAKLRAEDRRARRGGERAEEVVAWHTR